ncbi:hypothetical protein ACIQXA_10210 [Streptomyces massasporeus]|uniref:hypothetical protein n=1 Tax=Streptomyces massasporeus TaxID=67324 RepID=UPI0038034A88
MSVMVSLGGIEVQAPQWEGGIPARLLKLPDPTLGNTRLPCYDVTNGPLTAVPDGMARLLDRVRETAGVH